MRLCAYTYIRTRGGKRDARERKGAGVQGTKRAKGRSRRRERKGMREKGRGFKGNEGRASEGRKEREDR